MKIKAAFLRHVNCEAVSPAVRRDPHPPLQPSVETVLKVFLRTVVRSFDFRCGQACFTRSGTDSKSNNTTGSSKYLLHFSPLSHSADQVVMAQFWVPLFAS